eukprot:TRINITY_DN5923_c0_g1_i1.p1 TRINITY_DN5923_c0_g1~~TRINITY_DN5923_c0_g1_i1.p1  ORF type:complete len:438 (+),score=86.53 TRINITY_DN5923_c0_g1_i1:103-1416(+)
MNDPLLKQDDRHDGYQSSEGRARSGSTRSTVSIQSLSNIRQSTVCGYLWVVSILLVVFGMLPWGIIELRRNHQETHVQAWFAAGVFVALAVPMTLWDIALHLRHWHKPHLQKHIVRIMLMVPIYSIDSWLGLRYPDVSIYFDTARETYEAYVIYNFYVYLLTFLRQRQDFDIEIHKRPPVTHLFPFQYCFKPWRMGQPFINACTHAVASYMVVRILVTIIAFCTELAGKYDNGNIDPSKSFLWLAMINMISQGYAMYCLVLFYYAFKTDLKPINPIPKFLTIKAVIFFSFWQAFVIAVLVEIGVIRERASWTYSTESVAAGIQDFLICVEMFIAALVHHRVFSYKEHLPRDGSDGPEVTFRSAIRNLLDISDVTHTVLDHVQTVATLDGRIVAKRNLGSERTALLTGQQPSLLASPDASPANDDYGSTEDDEPRSNV